jgi:hypothetical protein
LPASSRMHLRTACYRQAGNYSGLGLAMYQRYKSQAILLHPKIPDK